MHHIVPWANCKEHKPDNLIVLCPNCHRLAGDNKIDHKSLYKYKEICQKLTNPPAQHNKDEVLAYIKFDPNTVTEILDAKNILSLIDLGTLNFAFDFEESFEDDTYAVNAIGNGSVNFNVEQKNKEMITIIFEEPCPDIVKLEFKY